ncbi:DUF6480 family protein [Antrihabitans stalactiti]|uniref:Uncharacterized protein n=1 Tax=Antrihabitans stalactiti TaxID=2584121 RepID=A0A848KCV6_9NOCA|nr:DUF6480 family protein [Antrihabitans stalactiti]NMN93980.1 hypothetical protein [Antrihabitans stalactiti]
MASTTDPAESGSVDAPGLEPGGGVPPGETPPDTGQTSGLSHPQPMPGRVGPIVALTAIAVIVLALVCFFVARAFSLF